MIEATEGAPGRDVRRGISTAVLRDFDLVRAVESAKAAGIGTDEQQHELAIKLSSLANAAKALFAEGGLSEKYLAALAAMYTTVADSGSKALVPLLAERLGRPEQTVKTHLKRSRRNGLLTAVAGKAGGELTDKAVQIIATLDLDQPEETS
ncbi:hypothetical protein [Streptomyces sp. UNOB3_S3]|uniref:hypothetical protein n=1 Tax=Streptomyces sp. UNOB3_S3 TaxID=2871682 RepID=UPI001E5A8B0B|nr:hypothetical protein [Streptomyces sp. UNOB3_S3]